MQNLSRLDEGSEEDAKGVNTTMGVLENLLEVQAALTLYLAVLPCIAICGTKAQEEKDRKHCEVARSFFACCCDNQQQR